MEYVDFHSHILPQMDDGPDIPALSAEMLEMLRTEAVCTVFATPHYYYYRESEASFLKRRAAAVRRLYDLIGGTRIPEIRLGAEIRLTKEMPELTNIGQLKLEGTDLALFEFPYDKYQVWMSENLHNISVKYQLTPVVAHVERYIGLFRKSDYEELLSVPNLVFQINTSSLLKKKTAEFTAALIREGIPVLFGSDCHNTDTRPPLMKTAFLQRKKFCTKYRIPETELSGLFAYQKSLL